MGRGLVGVGGLMVGIDRRRRIQGEWEFFSRWAREGGIRGIWRGGVPWHGGERGNMSRKPFIGKGL